MVQLVGPEKPRPRFIEPMECTRVPSLPEGDSWLYEIKQDGYRAIAVLDAGTALLYSMSGLNYTEEFPHVAFALKTIRRANLVLDGEIVALNSKGRASFQQLQNRKNGSHPIIYYVFDILHSNGKDLLDVSLRDRRKILEQLAKSFADPIRLNPVFRTQLPALIEQVRALGLEGVVAKRDDSVYVPGRKSESWQKHRFSQEDEFVIGGYVASGNAFSSLIIGEYRRKDLYYVKRVAGGFNAALRQRVYKELQPLKTSKCPFVNLPEPNRSGHGLTADKMKDCIWLKPERRCEVEFVERTQSGRLRHASFRRLVS